MLKPGRYTVVVNSIDVFGNEATYDPAKTFEVAGNAAPSDLSAPELVSVDVSGSLVAGERAHLQVTLSDDSGIDNGYVGVIAPDGSWVMQDIGMTGDAGTTTLDYDFTPPVSKPGRYTVVVNSIDVFGNEATYDPAKTFEVAGTPLLQM